MNSTVYLLLFLHVLLAISVYIRWDTWEPTERAAAIMIGSVFLFLFPLTVFEIPTTKSYRLAYRTNRPTYLEPREKPDRRFLQDTDPAPLDLPGMDQPVEKFARIRPWATIVWRLSVMAICGIAWFFLPDLLNRIFYRRRKAAPSDIVN